VFRGVFLCRFESNVFDFSKTPDVPVACGERKKVTLVDETVDITGTMKWFDPSKGFGFILGGQ
jgi:hypothetical protein